MLAAALTIAAPAVRAASTAETDALVRRAFVYSFPIHEMGRLRARAALNAMPGLQFMHRRNLSTPDDRSVTTPNNDTLYSSAWLNLAHGPVKLSVPDTQGRYYSLAMIDAATDDFATIGRRTTGTHAGEFVVVGPDWISPLPDGLRVIRAPGNDVLLLLRVLVDGPGDLSAARRVQDGFALAALQPEFAGAAAASAAPAATAASAAAVAVPPAQRYLALVNQMLARNPPPSYERLRLEQFAAVGVCGAACTWDSLPAGVQARWNALLPAMTADLERHARESERIVNGWAIPAPAIGHFGTNYQLRADTALVGLLALDPAEAMYLICRQDGARRPLEGTHAYRLHLPRGAIPVDAFWSLTIYEKDMDGHLFFVANPIKRYSIGDHTPGLRRNSDGSIDLWIQRADPGRSRAPNWLPAPPGPFVLALRAYEPRIQLRDGQFLMPGVERIE